eukprot:4626673-Alexandrium_andersonii.AAC.1
MTRADPRSLPDPFRNLEGPASLSWSANLPEPAFEYLPNSRSSQGAGAESVPRSELLESRSRVRNPK